jgi:hypothetical protein
LFWTSPGVSGKNHIVETVPASPTSAYAPEFASRVGAILAALLALIARRLAGHPLLAPLSHRLTAIAEEFERLLADLAAGPPPRPHTGPTPHPENLRRPNPPASANGWPVAEAATAGSVAVRDPPAHSANATTRTSRPSVGVPQPSPARPPMRTSPGGVPRDRLPAPPPRSRTPRDRPTRIAPLTLRIRNYGCALRPWPAQGGAGSTVATMLASSASYSW